MNAIDTSLTFKQKKEDIIRLNNWIFSTIQPYIKGRTLEMGSGLGEMSSIFLQHTLPLHLSEENESKRKDLQKIFQENTTIKMIHNINFYSQMFLETYGTMIGAFDTIVAVNIAEHGFYDTITLNNAKHLLRRRGHFVVIAPSKAVLFNDMEQDLSDLKEYNLSVARNLMGETFEILKVRCFNWAPGPESEDLSQFGLSILAILRKQI